MSPQEQREPYEHAQGRFIGRIFVVPLAALVLMVIWVVISSVMTPTGGVDGEAMLSLRFAMIGFGGIIIGLTSAVAIWKLLHW